jgi:hypothetical protein
VWLCSAQLVLFYYSQNTMLKESWIKSHISPCKHQYTKPRRDKMQHL